MLVDLTLKITPKMTTDAQGNLKKAFTGHLGTHFDVMNKEFPLEYVRRQAIVFDVSDITDRDIETDDIDIDAIQKDMFVAFYTGYVEKVGYGSREYFAAHPVLSEDLIEALLEKGISIIGIDCAGVRMGKQHTPMDQHCADHGVFIVENLCNLKSVVGKCVINTYPMNYAEMSGLPCRVVAETDVTF